MIHHGIQYVNPKDVAEEKASEKDVTGHNVFQMDEILNDYHGNSYREQVIDGPVLISNKCKKN